MQLSKTNPFTLSQEENKVNNNLPVHLDIRLLKGFSLVEKEDFLKCGNAEIFKRGEQVTSKVLEDSNFYIVTKGTVSILRLENPVQYISVGGCFNESVFFFPVREQFSARAETDAILYRFGRKEMLDYFSQNRERLFKIFTLNTIAVMQQKIVYYECQIARYRRRIF